MHKILLVLTLAFPLLASAADPDPQTDLKALGFGLAIGVERYKSPYIEEATTNGTNRVVSIDKEYKSLPSAWLTLNWNFLAVSPRPSSGSMGFMEIANTTSIAAGMFAGVKLIGGQSNQSFDGFAIGPQVTFKTGTGTAKRDISVGLGYVSHKTRALANGIVDGKPLPADFTDIKYRQKSEDSWMIMLSVVL